MKGALAFAYRCRGVMIKASIVILVLNVLMLNLPLPGVVKQIWGVLIYCALITFAAGYLLAVFGVPLAPKYDVRGVLPPVAGRWLALNSPATKVPSHGVRMYGQSYAIDLVFEPEDRERPAFGSGSSMRPSDDYPAFGASVYAMVSGEVVRSSDWRRDHRARSTMLGYVFMIVEAMVREIGGSGFIIGNHVTIRTDDGIYATTAHLQRESALVRVGERVRAGQQIGSCGNSGNSSEPHVHAQLSDRKSFVMAHGMPFAFTDVVLDESAERVGGVPATGHHMIAASRRSDPV